MWFLITFLIVGFIAGLVARALVSGPSPRGFALHLRCHGCRQPLEGDDVTRLGAGMASPEQQAERRADPPHRHEAHRDGEIKTGS